ncbi:cold-shock protein [Roseateles saccharophilus]|uniref:Cold shock CspA family protein n=1 Tax=Roseateles saccharophilus TaxID=304 RepID=A0A4R3VEA9_ROSSA|nr:cold shock domain-containing protein [Roseateles saccharophilus]MDG0834394.1 cold shock domain-containing protein [Roseateles saccharophilus]TCV01998.1 cold shock CspA family protein [Roseateles saccharophilus]
MRFEGVLSAWNHDAGYGTIRPLGGGEEVFVALAAFPTDGEGPRLDEPLSFEIVTGRDGRKQAVSLKRLPRLQQHSAMREAAGVGSLRVRQARRKRRLSLAAGAVVAVLLVAVGGAHWWPHAASDNPVRAGR